MNISFPLVLDGATGTQLQKKGFDNKTGTEEWVLNHPEAIQEIQRAYAAAGSDVIYAPTFGANRVKLEANGISGQVEDYNARLVALSREAAGGNVLVAGDISPIGKFLEPMGDASFEEMYDIYREQAAALEAAGVDLYVIETMMTVPEARAAVLAVKSVSEKPVFVTFTCDKNGRTLGGTDVTAALCIMQGMGVDAFGLNCSVGPEDMLMQIRRMSRIAQIPLIAKPNAGMPDTVDGKVVYHCPPEEFTSVTRQFAEAGVGVFGGCCGTEESHIAALRGIVDQLDFSFGSQEEGENRYTATETELIELDRNPDIADPVPCDEDLAEAAEDAADEEQILCIALIGEEELENLTENQYAFTTPVCFSCEDGALLEKALRLYQGRALYQGNLSAEELKPLKDRYGLITKE